MALKQVELDNLQCVGNKILIKLEEDEIVKKMKASGLHVPQSAHTEHVTAGIGFITNTGNKVENYKVGDKVMFHLYVGYDLRVNRDGIDEIYKVIPDTEIMAVIKDK